MQKERPDPFFVQKERPDPFFGTILQETDKLPITKKSHPEGWLFRFLRISTNDDQTST